ncbi:MAG: NnrS family protein [Burkholderiaceae bacterium]
MSAPIPSVSIDRPTPSSGDRFALFALGFRPFYLLAASYAAVAVPIWIAIHTGHAASGLRIAPLQWHMHEMVFGFAVAVLTGFLLTAAHRWTGRPTPTGRRLAALAAIWIGARALFQAGLVYAGVALDSLFLVLVALALARMVFGAGNRRNYFVVGVFALLAMLDAWFAIAVASGGTIDPNTPLRAALYLVVVMTSIFGGRVIPAFTGNALPGVRIVSRPRVAMLALILTALALFLELAPVPGPMQAALCAAAAIAHLVRMAGWSSFRTLARPLLWVLHIGYAWTAIGLGLMAAASLGLVARPLAIHAFAIGTIATLIIGMITRTALGHTGRALHAGRAETAMYVAISLAALVRVGGGLLPPSAYLASLVASGVLWSLGFGLYALVYWPRLAGPRVDGRPG